MAVAIITFDGVERVLLQRIHLRKCPQHFVPKPITRLPLQTATMESHCYHPSVDGRVIANMVAFAVANTFDTGGVVSRWTFPTTPPHDALLLS